MSPIRPLLAIVSSGVAEIESTYAAQKTEMPAWDDPLDRTPFIEDVQESVDLVLAAAAHLLATLKPRAKHASDAGVRAASGTSVPEMLSDADAECLHVDIIAWKNGASSKRTGRILRLLAARHIFREVSPDYFANSRLSAMLDVRGSGLVPQSLLERTAIFADEPVGTPVHRALHTSDMAFGVEQRSDGHIRHKRSRMAMRGKHMLDNTIQGTGFSWQSLEDGAVVVDVGGGLGTLARSLAKEHPHLRFVVQDQPSVADEGARLYAYEEPELSVSNQVQYQAHDFFTPQSVANAAVFLICSVLHNWPDAPCKTILCHLRVAAKRSTRVVIMDHIVRYSCASTSRLSYDAGARGAPAVPNPTQGEIDCYAQYMSLVTKTQCAGAERTIGGFVRLVEGTGWKIDAIHQRHIGALGQIVLSPLGFEEDW